MTIAHLTFNFRLRGKGSYGVNDDDVNCAGAHQHIGNLQGLLTGIWLGNQEVIGIHAKQACILWVERVLGVNKRGNAAVLLCRCNGVQRNSGLTRRLRAIDFYDAPARETTNTQSNIDCGITGRNGLNRWAVVITQAHHSAFAVILLNHGHCGIEGLLAVISLRGGRRRLLFGCH